MLGPSLTRLPSPCRDPAFVISYLKNFQSISVCEYDSLSCPEYLDSDLACPFYGKKITIQRCSTTGMKNTIAKIVINSQTFIERLLVVVTLLGTGDISW